MELERDVLVSPPQEVPMVEGEVVLAIRALADCGVGSKAIARAGWRGAEYRAAISATVERGGGPRATRRATTDGRSAPRGADAV